MPTYEFSCIECGGLAFVSKTTEPGQCPLGHKGIKRRWGFAAFHRGFAGGFSATTGGYVSNEHQLSEQLKAGSEAASEQTGMEHRFVPGDPRDRDLFGVTDE